VSLDKLKDIVILAKIAIHLLLSRPVLTKQVDQNYQIKLPNNPMSKSTKFNRHQACKDGYETGEVARGFSFTSN